MDRFIAWIIDIWSGNVVMEKEFSLGSSEGISKIYRDIKENYPEYSSNSHYRIHVVRKK